MRYYPIGEFVKLIGRVLQVWRSLDKDNILKPHHVVEGGIR